MNGCSHEWWVFLFDRPFLQMLLKWFGEVKQFRGRTNGSIHLNSPGRKDHKDINWYDSVEHKKQLGFNILLAHMWDGLRVCSEQLFLSYLCAGGARERFYEDVPVVPSRGPAKPRPLFPGWVPPHKPHCQRKCVMPRSVWFVDKERSE